MMLFRNIRAVGLFYVADPVAAPELRVEPEQLALELSTMLTGADIAYLLHRDSGILDRIRAALRARLGH